MGFLKLFLIAGGSVVVGMAVGWALGSLILWLRERRLNDKVHVLLEEGSVETDWECSMCQRKYCTPFGVSIMILAAKQSLCCNCLHELSEKQGE